MFGIDDLILGGLSMGGSLMTNLFNKDNQKDQMQFNSAQAQMNRDFQERMSNTQYQRGMADMKTAGLNPILAYQKGGASSPSGATASTSPITFEDSLSKGVNSAMASKQMNANVANLVATNEQIKANTWKTQNDAAVSQWQIPKVKAEAESAAIDSSIKKEALKSAVREGLKGDIDKDLYSTPAGRILRQLGTGGKELSAATGAVFPAVNSAKGVWSMFRKDGPNARRTPFQERFGFEGSPSWMAHFGH